MMLKKVLMTCMLSLSTLTGVWAQQSLKMLSPSLTESLDKLPLSSSIITQDDSIALQKLTTKHKDFSVKNSKSKVEKQENTPLFSLNWQRAYRPLDYTHQHLAAQPQIEMPNYWHDVTTFSDLKALQNRKHDALQFYADAISAMTGRNVKYERPLEDVLNEEAYEGIVISKDMLFDYADTSILLLDAMTSAGQTDFLALTDETLANRLALIERDVAFNFKPEVRTFIEKYAVRYPKYTADLIKRSNVYFPIFEQILAEYDMPDELKYLVVVESAFKTKARSHAGAVGLWQFMPRTGDLFGLRRNYYIDERMDPVASTIAACKYLKYLHQMFGDWELALASYNCGPGNVKKAQRRSGKVTFWEIYDFLPRETRNYVPLYVSFAYLFNYPTEHSIPSDRYEYGIPFERVSMSRYINLKKLADEINVCYEDLLELNPALKQGVIPANAKEYPLNIPTNRLAYFQEKQEDILLASASNKYVAPAKATTASYGTPVKPTAAASLNTNNLVSKKATYHIVKTGETLGHIALKYDISVKNLQQWNGLSTTKINSGQKLSLKPNTTQNQNNNQVASHYYTVKSGDTLWKIAQRYPGLTVAKIKSLNALKSDHLQVGQKLKVKG
ncbi:MAG: LysM peptidoglycan-binding domain-containing protein [Bernardetiaceae bacterium]|nr:LysM peptidoglycan-binding domain-containing protein [Bernardetiaceae bacterium]